MPKARRAHGLRAIENARKVLAARTAAGNDPRAAARSTALQQAIADSHRSNRRWTREHPGERDEAWFKREIVPKLDAFRLRRWAWRRGYRSRPVRASGRGARPHPRHWEALLTLIERSI